VTRARILFVDDDLAVLDALRDLLRKERKRWDVVFATGGEQALKELRRAPFDIVISDMCMPGMDGAALLARVKAEFPDAARLVLSGHAEREAVLRAIPVAHQFLSKPCDAATLRATLERTYDLRALLANDAIRAIVGKLERLPSVPNTYFELTRAAANADTGTADLAAIVQRDPAMSVKVLQLVNSAYFGIAQRVSSIQQAIAYLGLELLKGLALTANAFSAMETHTVEGFSLEAVQSHSIRTARLVKHFLSDPRRAEEAFTTALVHDVGKIVIALGLPAEFAEVAREARAGTRPPHQVEQELLGVTHAEVGAYLLGMWGLPSAVVKCVAFHHNPDAIGEGPLDTLAALHAADVLSDIRRSGEAHPDEHDRGLNMSFLRRAGFAGELPHWRAIVEEQRAADRAA
jgi:HD-like signal output (HDOD) protein